MLSILRYYDHPCYFQRLFLAIWFFLYVDNRLLKTDRVNWYNFSCYIKNTHRRSNDKKLKRLMHLYRNYVVRTRYYVPRTTYYVIFTFANGQCVLKLGLNFKLRQLHNCSTEPNHSPRCNAVRFRCYQCRPKLWAF